MTRMPMPHVTSLLQKVAGLMTAAALLLPTAAGATMVFSNGGNYFTDYGPERYWFYDWNEGYCGKFGKWCGPNHFQWTYENFGSFSPMNYARWNVIPVAYPSHAYAFIPRRNATTRNAEYTVHYAGVSRAMSYVDQLAYYDQWASLAYGDPLYMISSVELTDNTFFGHGWGRIAFDEIKIEN